MQQPKESLTEIKMSKMSMFNNTQYLYSPTLTENSYGGGAGLGTYSMINQSAPPQSSMSLERNGNVVLQ